MSIDPKDSGLLYVVATPIGNRQDISLRAVELLREVDLIAAEDTRHSARLMESLGIATPLISFHDFSSAQRLDALLQRLQSGKSLALVSDAGTPGIADPGYELVRAARQAGIQVIPLPGPSAVIAALCVSGLPSDRFIFEGFLPARSRSRQDRLGSLVDEQRTMIFYESPHRIIDCLEDFQTIMGADRELFIARELTKRFETTLLANVEECLHWVCSDPQQQKGEFVLVLAGMSKTRRKSGELDEGLRILRLLKDDVPLKRAARLAADISGAPRNALYRAALQAADNDTGENEADD